MKRNVLQLCHGYKMPFFDVSQQYASLFKDTDFKVVTVFLTGPEDSNVAATSTSDKVIFFELSSTDIKGLKLGLIHKLYKLCKEENIEFVIAHRYKAIYLSCMVSLFLSHLEVIGVAHAYGVLKRRTRKLTAYSFKKRLSLLGVSNSVRDDIRTDLPRFPQSKIQTLYNRINIEELTSLQLPRQKARNILNIPNTRFVFANVGRLHPDKDQTTLIKAFAKASPELEDAYLYIFGTGKIEDQLKQLVTELSLEDRIIFKGVVPDVRKYFRAFDCFALSSDNEPFGMVLLEAIAADLPVISTCSGGAGEIINCSERVFNVGDSNRLSKLLIDIIRLGKNAKAEIAERQKKHLLDYFTYSAGRKRFWSLPFINYN